ncbi:MAG: valine--tRNA ligase [Alphaproteobacteria bacterium]|nr:valine--tRNA ligase [Alphaproteobacteria bacterium]MCB9699520.1 valine--tRNA ligase [Alphaproteobacteria bacterium]
MSYDHLALEADCRALWEREHTHDFDRDGDGEIFAVDTPPPYVSAAHLHVGHAMSYTQAEIVVRWHRMKGRRPFYPMGFDDNGLPTERYVERTLGIDKSRTTRSDFRAHCLEETARGARAYEELWRSLGLSVDWSLRYSTIDERSRRVAQRSFLRLYRQGRITRSEEPVLWDPELRTSLAQADLETVSRRTKLYTLRFGELRIATTRPELLPACVALYRHPDDPRHAGLTEATVPLEGRVVPVLTDTDVDPAFGTGLMMVCTFGDADDVRRWRRDGLPTRLVIGPDGRIDGRTIAEARKRTIEALGDACEGFVMTEQAAPTSERSGAPVEWQLAPAWSLRVLDLKDRLLQRSAELRWHLAWMKARLDQWIEGLRWDWNLSRQRFYGVPFPVWHCEGCGEAVLADEDALPVDPLEDAPPLDTCPRCGGALHGDPDVMDTWMTSSCTPMINAEAGGPIPMGARVQAFEIIRSWLFYTLVKGELELGALPWRDVMISGWGLDEQGRKISKRHLEQHGDRYDPGRVIVRYGADALRHWAARSQLGHDLRYVERDVKAGRRVAVKLYNAARLAELTLEGFDPSAPRPPVEERPPEDRDLLWRLDRVIEAVDGAFATYDYATGLAALDRFFFATFCDDWLEILKARTDEAARATLFEAFRAILGLYAPYVPFITESLWQRLYRLTEGGTSLHRTRFPEPQGAAEEPAMALVTTVLQAVRAARTAARIPQSRDCERLVIDPGEHDLRPLLPTLRAACRARELVLGPAEHPLDHGLAYEVAFAAEVAEVSGRDH